MKTIGVAIAIIAFAGCAATTANTRTLDKDTATLAFPERITGGDELPVVRQLNVAIDTQYDGQIESQVKVCVKPSGDVASAEVIESSGLASYDDTVVTDAKGWKYEGYEAPESTVVCQVVKVSYKNS